MFAFGLLGLAFRDNILMQRVLHHIKAVLPTGLACLSGGLKGSDRY